MRFFLVTELSTSTGCVGGACEALLRHQPLPSAIDRSGNPEERERERAELKFYLASSGGDINGATRPGSLSREHVPKLSILLSYHYYADANIPALLDRYLHGIDVRIFADSGAFSAMSKGAPIEQGRYVDWVKANSGIFEVYSNLDVIGDPKRSQENLDTMEAAGLRPIPVFHTGSPMVVLDRLVERYPYVALGGMVPWSKDPAKLGAWMRACFARAKPETRFHGFGMTSWDLIRAFPWYSVDSSSWTACFRFGTLALFDPTRGEFVSIPLRDVKKAYGHSDLIRSYGFSPSDLAIKGRYKSANIAAMSVLSYLRAERWLSERRERERESRTYMTMSGGNLTVHLKNAADHMRGGVYLTGERDIGPHLGAAADHLRGER